MRFKRAVITSRPVDQNKPSTGSSGMWVMDVSDASKMEEPLVNVLRSCRMPGCAAQYSVATFHGKSVLHGKSDHDGRLLLREHF